MRNLVIYELETDYARYLRSLGASERLVRKYAYRNAVLPQLSGLALPLGVVIGGNIVTEVVFQYPGLGHLIYHAITDQDYFLLQGIFFFIIIGVLHRQLHHRHRLCDRRPEDPPQHAGSAGMSVTVAPSETSGGSGPAAPTAGIVGAPAGRRAGERSAVPRAPALGVRPLRPAQQEVHARAVQSRSFSSWPPSSGRDSPPTAPNSSWPRRLPAPLAPPPARDDLLRRGRLLPVCSTACGTATWSGSWAPCSPAVVGLAVGFAAGWRGGLPRRGPADVHQHRRHDARPGPAARHRLLTSRPTAFSSRAFSSAPPRGPGWPGR